MLNEKDKSAETLRVIVLSAKGLVSFPNRNPSLKIQQFKLILCFREWKIHPELLRADLQMDIVQMSFSNI